MEQTTDNNKHKQEIMKVVEKAAWHSKKFLAFLIVEIFLFTMAVLALKWQQNLGWPLASFMLAIVLCMAFIVVAFNLNQTKLDSFVRVAALAAGKVPKDIEARMTQSVADSEEPAPSPDKHTHNGNMGG